MLRFKITVYVFGFLCDPKSERKPIKIRVFGTGHEHPKEVFSEMTYFRTFQIGSFIGHLFLELNDQIDLHFLQKVNSLNCQHRMAEL